LSFDLAIEHHRPAAITFAWCLPGWTSVRPCKSPITVQGSQYDRIAYQSDCINKHEIVFRAQRYLILLIRKPSAPVGSIYNKASRNKNKDKNYTTKNYSHYGVPKASTIIPSSSESSTIHYTSLVRTRVNDPSTVSIQAPSTATRLQWNLNRQSIIPVYNQYQYETSL
jgi:hypothetical protein